MSFRFNRALSLIIIRAKLDGPSDSVVLRLALDTGSSHTVIDSSALESVGIAIPPDAPQFRMTTPTSVGSARRVGVNKLTALCHEQANVDVMTHELPTGLRLDGILRLDFLRDHTLAIDFRQGLITLA